MALPLEKKRICTYEDYLNTPDDERYQLLEGELIMTPAPAISHQRISRKLEYVLEKHITENGLGEVFDAPCDVYLDNHNVVQPDLLFIAVENSRIVGEANINGAPDLVVEILSENSAYCDMVKKKKLYARFGVKEYWIVDPMEREIEVHVLRGNFFEFHARFTKNDRLESTILSKLQIDLANIFE